MKLGVIFPQTEIGSDPIAVRDFAQAAESLGYEHLRVLEHVLGADASKRESWEGSFSHTDTFHEPFVLFGYLAGLTEKIQMTTGILILPQRQTALVAKQAAAVDVLTGGRLRLGIGVGWNDVEYVAQGVAIPARDGHDRFGALNMLNVCLICIGANGHDSGREFLEAWRGQGNTTATAALEMFGAPWDDIRTRSKELDERPKAPPSPTEEEGKWTSDRIVQELGTKGDSESHTGISGFLRKIFG